MPYSHGIKVTETATKIAAPVKSTAGLQVVFGTAPINLLEDPASAVNKLILCLTLQGTNRRWRQPHAQSRKGRQNYR